MEVQEAAVKRVKKAVAPVVKAKVAAPKVKKVASEEKVAKVKVAKVKGVNGEGKVKSTRTNSGWRTETFKVSGEATRGFLKEFVDFAKPKKSFKLQTMLDKFSPKVGEDKVTRYFYWCMTHGLFSKV